MRFSLSLLSKRVSHQSRVHLKLEGAEEMNYARMKRQVLTVNLPPEKFHHRQRLWRVALNVRDHAKADCNDERLLHLMSRVGGFSRELAQAVRVGDISASEAADLLDLLADIGDLSFDEWLGNEGQGESF